jgi:hypothetical protein
MPSKNLCLNKVATSIVGFASQTLGYGYFSKRPNDQKTAKERRNLDLEADDVEAEVKRLEALGATRWDHQVERGSNSGSCVTHGATNLYTSTGIP